MAITATVTVSTSVATVSSLAGGTLAPAQTMTYAAQTQPVTPAVSLGTQLTGTTGSNGTYNVNNLTTLSSTTVTFLQTEPPQIESVVPSTNTQNGSNTPTNGITMQPPVPLPQTKFGTNTQTSYST